MADYPQPGAELDVADHQDVNFARAKASLKQYTSQPGSVASGNNMARANQDAKYRMQSQQADMDYIYGKVGF